MSKMKTKKGASKRFTTRPGGTIKRGQTFRHHTLTKKIIENKRYPRSTEGVHETNLKSVRAMMPYA